jgi:hypothetical protein
VQHEHGHPQPAHLFGQAGPQTAAETTGSALLGGGVARIGKQRLDREVRSPVRVGEVGAPEQVCEPGSGSGVTGPGRPVELRQFACSAGDSRSSRDRALDRFGAGVTPGPEMWMTARVRSGWGVSARLCKCVT